MIVSCRALAASIKGRCRNRALGNGFCAQHAGGNSVGLADVVLVKFSLNEERTEGARSAGFLFEERSSVSATLTDASREVAAEKQNRNAYRYRDSRPDTGTLVFDPQLERVEIKGLSLELIGNGYCLTKAVLKDKTGQRPGAILLLAFERGEATDGADLTDQQRSFVIRCLGETWRFCHVYSNPEKDGKRMETVNLNSPTPGERPRLHLLQGDGSWHIENL